MNKSYVSSSICELVDQLTRSGQDDSTKFLVNEVQRRDTASLRIAVEELRNLLPVEPVVHPEKGPSTRHQER